MTTKYISSKKSQKNFPAIIIESTRGSSQQKSNKLESSNKSKSEKKEIGIFFSILNIFYNFFSKK